MTHQTDLKAAGDAGPRHAAAAAQQETGQPVRRWRGARVWQVVQPRKAKARKEAEHVAGDAPEDPGADPQDAPVPTEQTEAVMQMADLVKPVLGAKNRPNLRRARRGHYFARTPAALSTTRQAQILNPALLASATDDQGVALGVDALTNSPVAHDQFTAYTKKIITSPHVIVLGVIGSGKSSLIKTVYVLRPLILKKRRALVLDRKDQGGEGEYSQLTREFGSEPYRFVIGEGGTRLSPLDPRIFEVIGASGQLRLLSAMAARATDAAGGDLDEWKQKALRVAYEATQKAAEAQGRVPVLDYLIPLLGNMDAVSEQDRLAMSPQAAERLHQAGVSVRFALERTLSDELNGLFNGETSKDLTLDSRLTTFDISQLPVDGPATAMVLGVAHTWLLGRLRKERGWGTNFIVEEGWDMMTGPIARHLNSSQMLARGLGLSTIAAMHHVAQAAGSAEGMSLLREPQTVHLYRQDREADITACVSTYGLDPQSEEALRNLAQGKHLLKIGSRPEVMVRHTRSDLEIELTDTDSAMQMKQVAA